MAGKDNNGDAIKKLDGIVGGELEYLDMLNIGDYKALFEGLKPDDYVIIAGGDGTLNRFINDVDGLDLCNDILYYPNGTGNDFAHDLGYEKGCAPFSVAEYIKDLPTVTVNGKFYRFINGIGYGVDGYCCEVGDELKKIPGKKVDYTAIAIKGLLFHFKPKNAKVTVDGKVYEYKKVWIAPTMNGRFYGGGMIPTPDQVRLGNGRKLSTMIFFGSGKLRTLMVFPSIFKGEHIKHTKMVQVHTGNEIKVEFDSPCALQIDGETVLNVTSYTAVLKNSSVDEKAKEKELQAV